MTRTVGILLIALTTVCPEVSTQAMNHPWHVDDRGGGVSMSGGVLLRSSIGQPASGAGASGAIILEGGYIPGLRFLAGEGVLEFQTEDQWNLLSVPMAVSDFRKTTIYPAATSAAFVYTGGYRPEDTLRIGSGFWLKFDSSVTVPFAGSIVVQETVDVLDKWNIIGSLSHPVQIVNITAIPPASIVSNFFAYSGVAGYFAAETLQPGYGYWVKVSGAGKVVLTGASTVLPSVSAAASGHGKPAGRYGMEKNSITVKDALGRERSVWFSSSAETGDPAKLQVPPLPPAGVLDVRFATDRMLEAAETGKTRDVALRISAVNYPLTIGWNILGTVEGATVLLLDHREIQLDRSGTATIDSPPSDVRLRLAPAASDPIPGEFGLGQNYPNPFNPSTRIPYQLVGGGYVSIVVFNLIGETVATLVDESQEAGYRTIEWNASTVPGGVYFCRMRTPGFEATRKLVLIK